MLESEVTRRRTTIRGSLGRAFATNIWRVKIRLRRYPQLIAAALGTS